MNIGDLMNAPFAALPTTQATANAAIRNRRIELTDTSGTVTVNFALGNCFTLDMQGNYTLQATGHVVGQTGYIRVKQDATGGRVLSFSADFQSPEGVTPTLTTGSSAIDILSYVVETDGIYVHVAMSDCKGF